jgi:hypothetical protein
LSCSTCTNRISAAIPVGNVFGGQKYFAEKYIIRPLEFNKNVDADGAKSTLSLETSG